MSLTATNVKIDGAGDTELHLNGQATSLGIDMSGAGKVFAFDFAVNDCEIETSGVGESEVNVKNALSIHSSGASTVKYKGSPSVTNDKSGASSVEKVN